MEDQLFLGRAHFTREEVRAAVKLRPESPTAAITRLVKNIGRSAPAIAFIGSSLEFVGELRFRKLAQGA